MDEKEFYKQLKEKEHQSLFDQYVNDGLTAISRDFRLRDCYLFIRDNLITNYSFEYGSNTEEKDDHNWTAGVSLRMVADSEHTVYLQESLANLADVDWGFTLRSIVEGLLSGVNCEQRPSDPRGRNGEEFLDGYYEGFRQLSLINTSPDKAFLFESGDPISEMGVGTSIYGCFSRDQIVYTLSRSAVFIDSLLSYPDYRDHKLKDWYKASQQP